MKVLIISVPRSGSTSIFRGLYNSLDGYMGFDEPFNGSDEGFGDKKQNYNLNSSNLIVKLLTGDLAFLSPIRDYIFSENYVSFKDLIPLFAEKLVEYSTNFNRIILLDRKNHYLAAQSLQYAGDREEKTHYHKKYKYNLNNNVKPQIFNFLNNHRILLNEVSKSLNLNINYYEDIYTNNPNDAIKFLNNNKIELNNFNKFYKFINLKNKYRQNE